MVLRRTSKEDMLNAELKAFSKKGYASAHVSDIIKQAGVARGTFYLYFESKRDAFEKVLAHILSKVEGIAPKGEINNYFPSPEALYDRICSTFNKFFSVFKQNSTFARIVFTEATGLDKGFDKQLENHYNIHRKNIRQYLEGVRNSGMARDFDIDITVEAIIGMVERCARTFLSKKNSIHPETLAQRITDFEFQAVCSVPLSELDRDAIGNNGKF